MRGELKPTGEVFVALLRGVNVGGKNMISMSALRASFERAGFREVSTYINSGNILFRTKVGDARKLERKIERLLAKEYGLDSKVVVRSYAEMARLIKSLPAGWAADDGWRYNVMFLRHTVDDESVLEGLKPRGGIEKVVYRPGALLWSARASDLTRAAVVKLPSLPVYQEMTVRNHNTTRKLYELLKKMSG
jgi:uncharacterized protein (DUF1697 family)